MLRVRVISTKIFENFIFCEKLTPASVLLILNGPKFLGGQRH